MRELTPIVEPWYRRILVALGLVAPLWEARVQRVWDEGHNKVDAVREARFHAQCGLKEGLDHFERITGAVSGWKRERAFTK